MALNPVTGIERDTKPNEFAEYNSFAESCKVKTKEELGLD